jgi:RNA polymerase sigma-70 factor (ECF subfamily)
LRQAAAGDEACFEALVTPHLEVAFRLAVTMLGDAGAAEDAVQEATFKAWRHLRRLRPGSLFRPWFLTVVANECRSQRRSRWWRVLRGLEQGEASETADPDPAGWGLEKALTSLSSGDRAAVFLRFYEDLSLREVASVLGISLSAAKSRLHRALRRLRLELSEEEVRA